MVAFSPEPYFSPSRASVSCLKTSIHHRSDMMPESSRFPLTSPVTMAGSGTMSISERRASKQRSLDGIKRKRDVDGAVDEEDEDDFGLVFSASHDAEAPKRQRLYQESVSFF